MGSPCCRIGDVVTGTCEANIPFTHPRQFTGVWTTGSDFFDDQGIPLVRVGDTGVTDCGHTIQAVEGSPVMDENGLAIHRVGDTVIVVEGGTGVSITGSDTMMDSD